MIPEEKKEEREGKEELKFFECLSYFYENDNEDGLEYIVSTWIQMNGNEETIQMIIDYCKSNSKTMDLCNFILPNISNSKEKNRQFLTESEVDILKKYGNNSDSNYFIEVGKGKMQLPTNWKEQLLDKYIFAEVLSFFPKTSLLKK
jgi:hypothetical protein